MSIPSHTATETQDAGHLLPDSQMTGGAVCVRCVPPASLLELAGRGVEPCPVFSQDPRAGFDGVPTVVAVVLGAGLWVALIWGAFV